MIFSLYMKINYTTLNTPTYELQNRIIYYNEIDQIK